MQKAIAVKFRTAQKHYYFDPAGLDINCGDYVVVETSRGMEIGIARGGPVDVSEKEFDKALRPILRVATRDDILKAKGSKEKSAEAVMICKQKIEEYNLNMKLIDAEYTLDETKLIFYFTSEERVDFRELVKDLAAQFKTRIDLRQIGVRDGTSILGGFGTCGRELCCKGWLTSFERVTIKMAKIQNLSLNPGKISGCCGRLMCCLGYENDVYLELKTGMPDAGEIVDTGSGLARVCDVNIFDGTLRVRYIEEERTNEHPEKLGTDLFEFDKSAVRRQAKSGKGKSGDRNADQREISAGIKTALKDEIIEVIPKR